MNNITITYGSGVHHVVTDPLYQGDYGQQITFAGIDGLPEAFEVHFSNESSRGISTRAIGLDNVVNIPNMYLQTGEVSVYGWIFLHDPATSGETEYTFRIPVKKKPAADPVIPTPPQEDVIAQAINAINGSAEDAAQSATDAQTAQGLAEDARDAAQTAQGLAETAQGKAEDAQEAAETAQGKAETAQGKAEDAQSAAEAQAVLAESYAKGGTNTRTGEDTDNAKYYSEQSAGSASTASGYVTDAQGYASDASGYANDAKDYKNAAGDYATEAYGYKNDASGSASEASGYANDAKGYKNDASGYASDASGYATAASGFATSAEAEALKAEGYAINKQNGENVGAGSPYYHNSAKYFASQAQNHAGDAGTEALKAEGFAVGKQNGSAVSSGSPYYQNNAEYYAGQAADSATSAATSAATFETDTTLSVSGKAADAKKVGDEVTDLKSQIIDILPTDTASGAIASFPDGANDIPLVDMTVQIEPVQSGTGDPSPGTATSFGTIEQGGINGEGAKVDSDIRVRTVTPIRVTPGTYIVEFDSDKKGTVRLYTTTGNYSSGDSIAIWTVSPITFTCIYDRDVYVVLADADLTSDITPSDVTKADLISGRNIRQISGWTGANINRVANNFLPCKNVADFQTYATYADPRYYVYIRGLDVDQNYTLTVKIKTSFTSSTTGRLYFRGASTSYIDLTQSPGIYSLTKKPSSSGYIDVELHKDNFTNGTYDDYIDWMMVTAGSSAASVYEPYQGQTIPISWQSEAGTVYGGYVNKETGKLVVDKAYVSVSSSDITAYCVMVSTSGSDYRLAMANSLFPGIRLGTPSGTVGDLWCNQFDAKSADQTYLRNVGISLNSSGLLHIYGGSNFQTVADFAGIAPLQIVYPLATPIEYDLSDLPEIKTLYGDNNIWADTGDVSVTYKADVQKYIDKKLSS